MVPSLDAYNALLEKATFVLSMRFDLVSRDGGCSVELSLGGYEPREDHVIVRARGVSRLQLERWGGGRFELGRLQVRDMKASQWEGVAFVVEDVEEAMLRFCCSELAVFRLSANEDSEVNHH